MKCTGAYFKNSLETERRALRPVFPGVTLQTLDLSTSDALRSLDVRPLGTLLNQLIKHNI